MTQNVELCIVLQEYYYELCQLYAKLQKNDIIPIPGDGSRMSVASIEKIFKLFPDIPMETIINNTNHYSGWYGTMGHMAKHLNEPKTYKFLISMGLNTSILDYYDETSSWEFDQ